MKPDNHLLKVSVKFLRMPPRKIRIVADLIRGKSVAEARNLLKFTSKASSPVLRKMLNSAMSSLEKSEADPEKVKITSILVDGGPTMKRWQPRAMGRAAPIRKRTSHIVLTLGK